jgi:hypothetical protein
MHKRFLFTFALSALLYSAASAQTAPNAQTTQQTPTGNRTAGTTANPVDPTSNNSKAISGATGTGSANTTSDAVPAGNARTTQHTPTGNHTAGTTSEPVDPTSKVSVKKAGAGAQLKGRKAPANTTGVQ